MAKIPVLLHVSFASQLVPALAYLVAPRRSASAAALVLGALVSVLSNVVGREMAATMGNNQVVTYVSSPVTAAFFLFAVRAGQGTAGERRVFPVGTLAFLRTLVP